MAPKNHALSRQPSKEEQEKEESSDEEEENSESESGETEEDTSSEEEEEKENQVITKPFKPQTLVQKSTESQPKSKSKSKSSGLDSDAESEGSPSDYKVQPIRKPPASSPAKRPNQEQDVSRISKKLKTGEKEEKKTSASTPGGFITRLWSDEDEITVLNGMIDVKKVKGNDNNSEEIYNLIKGKLQGDFSKEQLKNKISRMKKRFLNALKKSDNGSDPVFSKPHEDLAFELSKKIWGDAVNGSVAVKNGNVKKTVVKNENVKKETVKPEVEEKASKREKDCDEEEIEDFSIKYPYLSSSCLNMRGSISEAAMNLLKENLRLIGDSKANELNQKWKKLFVEEAELNTKMLDLMAEQTKLAFDQMNDS